MDMYNNNYYGQQPNYYGGAAMYNAPMYYNNAMITPQNNPSLTAEEMKLIQTQNPSKIDISISEVDKFRAICNHKDQNKVDRVCQVQDGSGDVFCPICNYRWNPENLSKDEVKELCDKLIAAMQNAKWVGDYGVQLTRDYFAMIPLLEKFPDLYEYAMTQFNKYCSTNGYQNANDAAIYNQYNSLMGYSAPNYGYGPQYNNPYMNQPQYQQAPVYGNPYAQQQAPVAQNATDVNPMQANPYMAQQPVYGNPYMNQPQYAPIAPTPGVGAPMGTMQAPNYAPAAAQPQQAQGTNTTVTENANGTTTSTTDVKLS